MDLELLYKNIGIKEMNAMQKSAFKASDNQQDIVLLSPTGSGKTLAFLIPILRDLKPDKFDDLIAMNALYRPGPIAYIPSFVRRKNGEEEIDFFC